MPRARFNTGSISQRVQIRRGGKLLWWEQGVLAAGGALMASPLALGHTVCATLIAAGAPRPRRAGRLARDQGAGRALFGATQMKSLVVVRLLCGDSEAARRLMLAAWQLLRRHAGSARRHAPHLEHLTGKKRKENHGPDTPRKRQAADFTAALLAERAWRAA
jgi:urease accessory protein UreH